MNDHTVILGPPVLNGNAGQQTLPAGALIEGFEICDVIGVGGFGIVYEAWDTLLQRQVALKEYLPASLALRLPNGHVQVREARHQSTFDAGMRSFINEARLLAQFDHAALVKVYRFWEMSGTAYMVMPLYRGTTFKQHIEQQQTPLEESQLQLWLVALTEALEVMHHQQCYHRDISPENILVQENTGLPILLDFGAARRAIGHVSQPFTVILKASYAPIEQYAELPTMTQGPWTDVYALAAVAHFLMTGKTPPASVTRMVNDSYTPLATLESLPFSMAMKNAVDRALAVQPQDRTQCMRQFREALLNQATIQTRPKRTWLLWVGAAVLFLMGFGVVRWIQPLEQPPVERTAESTSGAPPVDAVFQAVLNRADQALSVQQDKTLLKIGEDLLQFDIRSPISGHVAVFVRSSDNALIQLLPNARVPSLAIEAGKLLKLPPPNEPIQAAGPAGLNQFLVVVTEQVRDYAHLNLQDHYGFGLIEAGQATVAGQTAVQKLQGLEGVSTCAPSTCTDRMAAGWFSVEEVD